MIAEHMNSFPKPDDKARTTRVFFMLFYVMGAKLCDLFSNVIAYVQAKSENPPEAEIEERVRKKRPVRVMVLEVGLEPTKAEAERFTVSCHCH